jgi:hypothetical protein
VAKEYYGQPSLISNEHTAKTSSRWCTLAITPVHPKRKYWPRSRCVVFRCLLKFMSMTNARRYKQTRFGLSIQPSTIHFIPLPSRHLVDDNYWTRFTLLGQSLGSMWIAMQGIGVIGKDGLWGDFFIGSFRSPCFFSLSPFLTRVRPCHPQRSP